MILDRGRQTFFVKGLIVNILNLCGPRGKVDCIYIGMPIRMASKKNCLEYSSTNENKEILLLGFASLINICANHKFKTALMKNDKLVEFSPSSYIIFFTFYTTVCGVISGVRVELWLGRNRNY